MVIERESPEHDRTDHKLPLQTYNPVSLSFFSNSMLTPLAGFLGRASTAMTFTCLLQTMNEAPFGSSAIPFQQNSLQSTASHTISAPTGTQ